MFGGVDPQRNERRLVHAALDVPFELLGLRVVSTLLGFVVLCLVAVPLAIGFLVTAIAFVIVPKHPGRVVLDLENVLPFELFAAGQVVVARFELEVHEVRLGDETRFGRHTW